MFGNPLCPLPTPFPAMIGLLDGMPATGALGPRASTTNLNIDRSTVVCAFDSEASVGTFTTCVGADFQGSGGAVVTNSIVSAYNTNFNIAVRGTATSSVELTNNLIDVDFLYAYPPPPAHTIFKWGLFADHIGAGSVRVYNNIFRVQRDDPFDNPAERLALREVVDGAPTSHLAAFTNNLLYVQDDVLASTGAPIYVRGVDATGVAAPVEYAAAGVNGMSGVTDIGDNFIDVVLLTGDDYRKQTLRLADDPTNPARGAARSDVAPDHDIDGEARPNGGLDVGPDEIP